jgi:MFS family permease
MGARTLSFADATKRAFGGLPRRFWVVAVGTFINRAGWFVMPFLAIYLTDGLHKTSSEAGLIVSLVGGGFAVGSAIGGITADRIGRRFTMLMGLAAGAGLLLVVGAMRDLWLIAASAVAYGVVAGTYQPAVGAFVADIVPASDRTRAYGLVYWAVNAGCAVGNTLAGLLAGYGFWLLFWGDAGTTLVYAVLVFAFIAETRPETSSRTGIKASFTAAFRDPVFGMFLLLAFAYWFIFNQCLVAFALDMRSYGISTSTYGVCMALNGIFIVLLQPYATPWLARYRSELVLAAGTLISGLGFGLYAVAHTPLLYGTGVVVWTLGEIAFAPRASAIVAELAPTDMRGRYQGAYTLATQLSIMVGPWLGAAVWQHLGREVMWTGLLGVAVLAAAGQVAVGSARRKRAVAAPATA